LVVVVGVDSGLFGPSSVTWHLHADPAMWIGGISALHLQALHPVTALGIAQNSSFEKDPGHRLRETGKFIVTTTWGTTAEAERAGARIRAMHARMRIRDRHGVERRLDEPELLLWVHCCLVRSNLSAVRRAGFTVSVDQADRYVFEQRRTADLVGLPTADAPGSVAELAEYLAGVRGALAASVEARSIHGFLLRPPLHGAHRALTPAWRTASRLAYSILPAWARDLYGRTGWPDGLCTASLHAARRAALVIPWHARLAFPEPALKQAVARLGRDCVPSSRALPVQPELDRERVQGSG
jgi:uncharacterized protein (DUF2236 family)